MDDKVLRVRVSLKGRPIRSYVFNQPSVRVGRDPGADLVLDNPGVSREHARLDRNADGSYTLRDLESANGTFLNDRPARREYLSEQDVIRIGKFSLWCSYEHDRRGSSAEPGPSPAAFDGTTVLKTTELQEMMESVREAEPEPPVPVTLLPEARASGEPGRRVSIGRWLPLLLAFALGYATSLVTFVLLFRQMRSI